MHVLYKCRNQVHYYCIKSLYLFNNILKLKVGILYIILLFRHRWFNERYTTRKIHTKLHPIPKWRIFHILTSGDISDIISFFFTVICASVVQAGHHRTQLID